LLTPEVTTEKEKFRGRKKGQFQCGSFGFNAKFPIRDGGTLNDIRTRSSYSTVIDFTDTKRTKKEKDYQGKDERKKVPDVHEGGQSPPKMSIRLSKSPYGREKKRY